MSNLFATDHTSDNTISKCDKYSISTNYTVNFQQARLRYCKIIIYHSSVKTSGFTPPTNRLTKSVSTICATFKALIFKRTLTSAGEKITAPLQFV